MAGLRRSLGSPGPFDHQSRRGRSRWRVAELTITADRGGSNGVRVRLWKIELQKLADETNLTLSVHHYPPGTSKWNRIEHHLFCHITQNWRCRPLTDRIAVVELIGATTTKAPSRSNARSTSELMKKASRSATPNWMPSTPPAMRSILPEPWAGTSQTPLPTRFEGHVGDGSNGRSHTGRLVAKQARASIDEAEIGG
jgi:Rhodopirellula transposase DDE domain